MENEPHSDQSVPLVYTTEKQLARLPMVLLFALLMSSVTVGIVLLGIWNGKKNLSSRQIVELPPASSQPDVKINQTIDQTTDWETYTNTIYRPYTIRYPKGWTMTSRSGQPVSSGSGEIRIYPQAPNPLSLEIEFNDDPVLFPKSEYSKWIGSIVNKWRLIYKPTKESKTTIAGVPAVVLEIDKDNPVTPPYVKFILFAPPDEDGFFTFTIFSETKQESLVFDQVISSFNFTN